MLGKINFILDGRMGDEGDEQEDGRYENEYWDVPCSILKVLVEGVLHIEMQDGSRV